MHKTFHNSGNNGYNVYDVHNGLAVECGAKHCMNKESDTLRVATCYHVDDGYHFYNNDKVTPITISNKFLRQP